MRSPSPASSKVLSEKPPLRDLSSKPLDPEPLAEEGANFLLAPQSSVVSALDGPACEARILTLHFL